MSVCSEQCKDLVADNAEKVYHPIVIVKSKQTKDGEYEEVASTLSTFAMPVLQPYSGISGADVS
eukprot:2147942-Rhodomonas_salina.2